MGFNTAISICNDGFRAIERNPGEFVQQIIRNYRRGGRNLGVGNHGGILDVQESEHADITQLIAVGGNFSTKLLSTYNQGWHHTEDSQIRLLKAWADKLGYRIVRKSGGAK